MLRRIERSGSAGCASLDEGQSIPLSTIFAVLIHSLRVVSSLSLIGNSSIAVLQPSPEAVSYAIKSILQSLGLLASVLQLGLSLTVGAGTLVRHLRTEVRYLGLQITLV